MSTITEHRQGQTAKTSSERSGVTRLSVNLANDVAGVLQTIANKRGTTLTETVRRAISMLAYFDDAQERGAKILVEDRDGTTREVVFP